MARAMFSAVGTRPAKASNSFSIRCENGCATVSSKIAGKILESKNQNYGYDAQNDKYCDMVKSGIIDPAKVVRVAVQDAASVAGLLITTEAMIADAPKEAAAAMPDMGGMGGGMGGMGGMM